MMKNFRAITLPTIVLLLCTLGGIDSKRQYVREGGSRSEPDSEIHPGNDAALNTRKLDLVRNMLKPQPHQHAEGGKAANADIDISMIRNSLMVDPAAELQIEIPDEFLRTSALRPRADDAQDENTFGDGLGENLVRFVKSSKSSKKSKKDNQKSSSKKQKKSKDSDNNNDDISRVLTPTQQPTISVAPSANPSGSPSLSVYPSDNPSESSSLAPSSAPSSTPSYDPTISSAPSAKPTSTPSSKPSSSPSAAPSTVPSGKPSSAPTVSTQPTPETPKPSTKPSSSPSSTPSSFPSDVPSSAPSSSPSSAPISSPSASPSTSFSASPSSTPVTRPSKVPTFAPTETFAPTVTFAPTTTALPTMLEPTFFPTKTIPPSFTFAPTFFPTSTFAPTFFPTVETDSAAVFAEIEDSEGETDGRIDNDGTETVDANESNSGEDIRSEADRLGSPSRGEIESTNRDKLDSDAGIEIDGRIDNDGTETPQASESNGGEDGRSEGERFGSPTREGNESADRGKLGSPTRGRLGLLRADAEAFSLSF